MKICVTGGAGFIGSNLVERLVAGGHEVSVLDNLSTGNVENLAGVRASVRFVEGDLRDASDVARAVRGCEVVFHQAALAAVARSVENPQEVYDVNVTGTLQVLEGARGLGVRRVVFASSSSVYGDAPTLPKNEGVAARPLSPYAATKAAGEALLEAWYATYGLETVALRYFNVYGPRQSPRSRYAAVVPRFVSAVLAGEAPTIYGDGEQTRDFTWVGDVVDALESAAVAPGALGKGPINLGGGARVSILELARLVAQAAGKPVACRHEPARAGDVKHSLADIRLAREALGWTPRTRLADGLARLVALGSAVPGRASPEAVVKPGSERR
jgi:UDP-glucose 4-epimerase